MESLREVLFGSVTEWFKVPVLKTGVGKPTVSSNLTASAINKRKIEMNITIGSPEVLILCGTILGVVGNPTGLVVFASLGCLAGVVRFASEHQDRNPTD